MRSEGNENKLFSICVIDVAKEAEEVASSCVCLCERSQNTEVATQREEKRRENRIK